MPSIAFILTTVLLLAPPHAGADTINACAKKTNGTLRLVADLGQCTSNEAPISWESEGPQGPAGPQGEPAPAPPRFELVGFTSATFDGDEGVLGFTLACQAEFPGTRMCFTQEALNVVDVPLLAGRAWIRLSPSLSSNTNTFEGASNKHCFVWGSLGTTGQLMDSQGRLHERNCVELHSVACCTPVP